MSPQKRASTGVSAEVSALVGENAFSRGLGRQRVTVALLVGSVEPSG